MENLEVSRCEKDWLMEFSPEKDVCLVMHTKHDQYAADETYPLIASGNEIIASVVQVGGYDFVYFTGERVKADSKHPAGLAGVTRHRVRLRNGEVRRLSKQYIQDNHTALYSEQGERAYQELLMKNGFQESGPLFGELALVGMREHDQGYEIINTPQYFIVKDKRQDKVYLAYTGMPCVGFRQVKNQFTVVLSDEANYLLKVLEIPVNKHEKYLNTKNIQGGYYDTLEELKLPHLHCQIDDFYMDIYTLNGDIYRMQSGALITYPGSTVERVVLERESDGVPMPLALVAECVYGRPRILALVDPITDMVVGKALNLVTHSLEGVKDTTELCALAQGTLRVLMRPSA